MRSSKNAILDEILDAYHDTGAGEDAQGDDGHHGSHDILLRSPLDEVIRTTTVGINVVDAAVVDADKRWPAIRVGRSLEMSAVIAYHVQMFVIAA